MLLYVIPLPESVSHHPIMSTKVAWFNFSSCTQFGPVMEIHEKLLPEQFEKEAM